MGIPKQLSDCLDQNNARYEILHHAEAVTAQRIAEAEHVKGRHQAKVVMLKCADQYLMAVLPADHHIDLEKIEKAIGKPVSLGKENDFKSLFPDSVIGAMPPFGIFMVCRRTSTNILPNRTTLCSKLARTPTR
jgi:Ala-tRNA(Pro) deacylase